MASRTVMCYLGVLAFKLTKSVRNKYALTRQLFAQESHVFERQPQNIKVARRVQDNHELSRRWCAQDSHTLSRRPHSQENHVCKLDTFFP